MSALGPSLTARGLLTTLVLCQIHAFLPRDQALGLRTSRLVKRDPDPVSQSTSAHDHICPASSSGPANTSITSTAASRARSPSTAPSNLPPWATPRARRSFLGQTTAVPAALAWTGIPIRPPTSQLPHSPTNPLVSVAAAAAELPSLVVLPQSMLLRTLPYRSEELKELSGRLEQVSVLRDYTITRDNVGILTRPTATTWLIVDDAMKRWSHAQLPVRLMHQNDRRSLRALCQKSCQCRSQSLRPPPPPAGPRRGWRSTVLQASSFPRVGSFEGGPLPPIRPKIQNPSLRARPRHNLHVMKRPRSASRPFGGPSKRWELRSRQLKPSPRRRHQIPDERPVPPRNCWRRHSRPRSRGWLRCLPWANSQLVHTLIQSRVSPEVRAPTNAQTQLSSNLISDTHTSPVIRAGAHSTFAWPCGSRAHCSSKYKSNS